MCITISNNLKHAMVEQKIESYYVQSYSEHYEMQTCIEKNIKDGWLVKCMNTVKDSMVFVVYEKQKKQYIS